MGIQRHKSKRALAKGYVDVPKSVPILEDKDGAAMTLQRLGLCELSHLHQPGGLDASNQSVAQAHLTMQMQVQAQMQIQAAQMQAQLQLLAQKQNTQQSRNLAQPVSLRGQPPTSAQLVSNLTNNM